MSVAMLEALLAELRHEGVEHIRVVHFEGRGDPLMNPDLDRLIQVTKSAYPKAFTMATTHGSYAYKRSIVESGLDLLRVSIDGAFSASYGKYRVGGNLATAIEFLRKVRDEKRMLRKHLQVHWKYILFEWNDSDDEMAHAARLADELDVRLRFVLTHSPGRSARFQTAAELTLALSGVAPHATIETTCQLKDERHRNADVESVISDETASLWSASLDAIEHHREGEALGTMIKALEYDPGITVADVTDCIGLLHTSILPVLSKAKFASTLSGMAAVADRMGDRAGSKRLFKRHLILAAKKDLVAKEFLNASKRMIQWLKITVALRTRFRNLLRGIERRETKTSVPTRPDQGPKHYIRGFTENHKVAAKFTSKRSKHLQPFR